uniref:nascent polypeptide-associated complex subunit alpha, muscle-specific form-like n=1 Tax=Nyctereutes procyonoides TaxID=34880 RepID=UPI00244486FB|nr:nascent polypeptide-associated complex subunit alpha, muscle-specific form-like [Nyctereutes procyonoides]
MAPGTPAGRPPRLTSPRPAAPPPPPLGSHSRARTASRRAGAGTPNRKLSARAGPPPRGAAPARADPGAPGGAGRGGAGEVRVTWPAAAAGGARVDVEAARLHPGTSPARGSGSEPRVTSWDVVHASPGVVWHDPAVPEKEPRYGVAQASELAAETSSSGGQLRADRLPPAPAVDPRSTLLARCSTRRAAVSSSLRRSVGLSFMPTFMPPFSNCGSLVFPAPAARGAEYEAENKRDEVPCSHGARMSGQTGCDIMAITPPISDK